MQIQKKSNAVQWARRRGTKVYTFSNQGAEIEFTDDVNLHGATIAFTTVDIRSKCV